jgi:hypothetical protein
MAQSWREIDNADLTLEALPSDGFWMGVPPDGFAWPVGSDAAPSSPPER